MSDFETQEFAGAEPIKSEREGLPPGYRMRADAHYVELLSSGGRSERARHEARPVTSRPPGDRRVLDHLSEEIAAIESAAAMLAGDPSPLARRVSLDLIKAQSARAAWLLRAHALLSGVHAEETPKSRPVAAVIAQIRERLAAECRLVGVSLQVTTDASATVTIDEAAVSLGVTGAVLALLPLLAGTEGAVIRIEAFVEEDGDEDDLQAIEISQDTVALPATVRQRFFEADWQDRPGGWLAATGAAVASATAERFGGRATLSTGARRGSSIRISFA